MDFQRLNFPDGSTGLPLKRVVIGPLLRDEELLVDTVGMMLERYQWMGVTVEASGIPYRL